LAAGGLAGNVVLMKPPSLTRLFASAGSAFALLLSPWWESTARADTTIIQHPGDHARYMFEAEPHLLFGFIDPPGYADGAGFGLGFRGSIPILHNGFIPKLNNSVAIGFGVDIARYGRADYCRHFDNNGICDDYGHSDSFTEFWFPVVLQWNFFLSRNWSVFGEPGVAINYHAWTAPHALDIAPLVMFVGGRYHFSDKITLTMRIGYPAFSVGCSFFL
jgi:hypothetical protein